MLSKLVNGCHYIVGVVVHPSTSVTCSIRTFLAIRGAVLSADFYVLEEMCEQHRSLPQEAIRIEIKSIEACAFYW